MVWELALDYGTWPRTKRVCGLAGLIPLFNTSQDEKVARETLLTGGKISSAKCWGNKKQMHVLCKR